MALNNDEKMLYYEEYGSGKVLVFLSGLLASTRYWKDIIPHIAKYHRVITVDMLGFGNSPKPDGEVDYSIDDNVRYYVEFFERLKLKKVTLVCFSSSSIPALRFVSLYPHFVDKLMLISPPVHLSKESAIFALRKSYWVYKYLMFGPLKSGFISFVSTFRNLLILTAPLFITDVNPDTARDVFKCSWKSLYNTIENIVVNQDVRSDLKNIKCKIKILYPSFDNIVREDSLLEISKEFPNIQLEKVDSTHQIPILKQQLVIDRILDLMQEP